jgi:hypothetical protein
VTSLRPVERPEAHGALVSPRPSFPRGVNRCLIERRVHLFAALEADVLDLSQPAARAAVVDAARGDEIDRRYDRVVSVAELVRFPDLVQALTGIDRLLADDGELILVEPVHHPGPAATLFASMWVVHPALADIHVERDLGLAVRTIGLTVTDLERFTMPTAVWPLRLFVHARVRRIIDQVAA